MTIDSVTSLHPVYKLFTVVDPSRKVLDLNCEVYDLLLEVVDLKQELLDLRSGGIPQI